MLKGTANMGNLHVIIGEDDYLVSQTAAKVIGDGTGLEVVDSANSGNEDLQLADIRNAVAAAISIKVQEPVFESQTKIRLGSTMM